MQHSGHFGKFGGLFVSELLIHPLAEIEKAFLHFRKNKKFRETLQKLLKDYAGRPTPLFFAERLSTAYGCKIFLKREDLLHSGAHKINNTLGQGLLAKFMRKKFLIAETGAGQHGVSVAMTGALLDMPVKIFMGAKDCERQKPNVLRMKLCGAEVIPVSTGSKTLKDAINEALRYYVAHSENTFYVFGSVAGPHPYPTMVKYFQRVIGQEARRQMLKQTGKLPRAVIACVGGGSNAIGIFQGFLQNRNIELIGVEAANGASLKNGKPGILHGALSYVLQNRDGQISEAHSIAAGLDYPSVGPEHSFLKETKRVKYVSANDKEALQTFHELARLEGILPALESSHALAYAKRYARSCRKSDILLVNLSGRGDKDLGIVTGSYENPSINRHISHHHL